MKKVYPLVAALAIFSFAAHAQTQLPNPGFEVWDTIEFQLDPAGYYTTDPETFMFDGYELVERTTDKHSGQYAVKISTKPNSFGGLDNGSLRAGDAFDAWIPFTGKPTKVRVWAKSELDSEVATIAINLGFDSGTGMIEPVAQGSMPFSGNFGWSVFEETLLYLDTITPNVLEFHVMLAGNAAGSLYLDDVEFIYGDIGVGKTADSRIELYPNPSNGLVHVAVTGAAMGGTLYVHDALGRVVYHQAVIAPLTVVALEITGIFTLSLQLPDGSTRREKLVVH